MSKSFQMRDMTPPFTFVIRDVLSIAVFSFTVHNLKTEAAAMEDTKKSQRNHPYTRKDSKRKKTAKQAAKDKLKGIIFFDALPPQDKNTSEYFKPEKNTPLQEMKSLVNKVGHLSEKSEVDVVEEGEITNEGTGAYPAAFLQCGSQLSMSNSPYPDGRVEIKERRLPRRVSTLPREVLPHLLRCERLQCVLLWMQRPRSLLVQS